MLGFSFLFLGFRVFLLCCFLLFLGSSLVFLRPCGPLLVNHPGLSARLSELRVNHVCREAMWIFLLFLLVWESALPLTKAIYSIFKPRGMPKKPGKNEKLATVLGKGLAISQLHSCKTWTWVEQLKELPSPPGCLQPGSEKLIRTKHKDLQTTYDRMPKIISAQSSVLLP